jgi:4'-phosphopantetheinyl transferase
MQSLVSVQRDGHRIVCQPDEVHVWRVSLDCSPAHFADLLQTLSTEERNRAARFMTHDLRRRWTISRGALRSILSVYVGVSPQTLVFSTEPLGKPNLLSVNPSVSFNLTHTSFVAFVAVTAQGKVGIDAEEIRDNISLDEVIGSLHKSEAQELRSLSEAARLSAFFACWTRKEAYLKAIGAGLHIPLDSFRVTVRQNDPPSLLWADRSPDGTVDWGLRDLTEPGLAIALATKPPKPIVRMFVFAQSGMDPTMNARSC